MVQIGTTLGYRMPETEFTLSATRRRMVQWQDTGSRLAPVVDVDLSHAAAADPTNRRVLAVQAGLLEQIALTVTLDGNGLMTAVNSETGRDISPVVSLIGKAIGLAASVASLTREPPTTEKCLEEQWADAHPGLASHLAALLSQVDRLLGALADKSASPDAVMSIGRALDAVQGQVASISQVRRDWIASKAGVEEEAKVRLRPFDLLRLPGPELPTQLEAPEIPALQRHLADAFGCLVAVIDTDRGDTASANDGQTIDNDLLCIRRSRAVTVGIYLKGKAAWALDQDSVQRLNIVDRFSEDTLISLDGSWLRTRSFELAFHPDMSIKTFGVTSVSSVSAVTTSLGDVFDAAAAARETLAKRPSAAAQELEAAKLRRDLLSVATEYEVLSATRERAAAVALAEQLTKLK